MVLHVIAHRRMPRFRQPRTFSEKVVWRALYDRDPALAWTCDKLAMKERVQRLDPLIEPVPTLWSGTDVGELADVDMPERWVVKPNHTSGAVYIGKGSPDVVLLEALTADWLSKFGEHESHYLGEWPYSLARRLLIAEPWIGDPKGDEVPDDYKFFVFGGVPRMIQVHKGRGADHRQYHYLPDWTPAPVTTAVSDSSPLEVPTRLDEMLRQAAVIGRQFDFMRVDFYQVGERVYFGEVTPFPASGLRRFFPTSFDYKLGGYWKIADT
ncbi:ATP-grasp fold amidoligase family protein [Blastococcus sp. SYSU DS0617]